MEDYVAERFMEATGKKVRRSNAMYVSDRHPFMMANADRLVVGENAGLGTGKFKARREILRLGNEIAYVDEN